MEEIGGEQAAGLGFEERRPLTARWLATRRGTETGGTHTSGGGGADLVPDAARFAVYASESPSGILGAEPDDQVADFLRQGRSPGRRRPRPLLLHQTPVPGQQGARGDDLAFAQGLGDQSGHNGEQCAVRPAGLGRGDLSTQNRELVSQDQYLRILGPQKIGTSGTATRRFACR
ncbi:MULTISPECIES: hypothetical protein [Streptomyces]|uniref:hypothetical protein n=1 Tax=Streptomyces TaxID=1883 RepID=UPI001FF6CC2E|nr:hypothetical protein [Streptomyces sp. AgN23]WTB09159.1 hypothetical protein OG546_36115 [Streptomyces antimycoticus]